MAKLRPRARIIRTIGDQLISGPEAALIELAKNSYDADSPDFLIKITPPSTTCPSGLIDVNDHGHGMTMEDVVSRWFEPATDDKLLRRTSPEGRPLLGAKGIGRFAASRLGTATTLITTAFEPDGALGTISVQIDWEQFSADKYLEEIEIPITRLEVSSESTGLSLQITGLRDVWSRKRLSNLIRELRRVAAPNDDPTGFQIRLDLSDFSMPLAGFDGPSLLQEMNVDATTVAPQQDAAESIPDPTLIVPFRLENHGDYRIKGQFSSDGSFDGTFVIERGDNVEQPLLVPAPRLEDDQVECGQVSLQLNVYDRESESVAELFRRMSLPFEQIGIRSARNILTDNAGVAIFRKGFRVRPYGEPENDWLELERMRVQDPSRKLGLSQVSGRVVIGTESESGLIERSSREGLEHNGQFDRLKTLIRNVLVHVEQRRVQFREKAGLSRRRLADVSEVRELARLPSVSRQIARLPVQFQEPVRAAILKDTEALALSLDEIDEYQRLLQSRAALGLVVAQVIHEGRRILSPMATAAKGLADQKDWVHEQTPRGDLFRRLFPERAEMIQRGARDMSRLFKRLDPVSGRRRGRPSEFSIRKAVADSVSLFDEILVANEILVDTEVGDYQGFGHPEDFHAAVLNIFENAIHWLASVDQESRSISIRARKIEREVQVAIVNNGPLIDPSYVTRLFEPGFSLKSDGTGLGLSIAREACRASKGDLRFVEGPEVCFVIVFPAASIHSTETR